MFTTPFAFLSSASAAFDPDAEAFFLAVEGGGDTLTSTEKTAVNDLVVSLKGFNLWTVFANLYPFVGGTSSSSKWNLKDPRDLNAAFRISWFGGMTFNSLGILGNSTNSGGNSHLNPQALGFTQMTMGCFINQNFAPNPTAEYDMGGFDGSDDFALILGFTNKTTKFVCYNATSYRTTSAGTYSRCLFIGQNNGTRSTMYQDTTELIDSAQVFANCNQTMGVANSWRGSVAESSGRGYSIMFMGTRAFTSSEVGNLNTAITAFNTTLSR